MDNDSSINQWIEGDSLGSSYGPSKEWISQNAVNEEGWEIPQPGQLQVDSWQSLLHVKPIVAFDLIVGSCEILVCLTEVKSWDQEDKNCDNERNEESEYFVSNENSEILLLSIKECGSNS